MGRLANNFAVALAECFHAGNTERTTIDALLKSYAGNATVKKSTLEETFADTLADLESDVGDEDSGGDESPTVIPLDVFLDDHVEKVIKHVPTDASADARYTWVLDTGERVETVRQHNALNHFADEIHDVSEYVVARETSDACDLAWYLYVRLFIRENKVEREETGERTLAIEDLQADLNRREVMSEIDDAATSRQIYLPDEDADYVWIPNKIIQFIVTDYEIDMQDLAREMDNRNQRGPRQSEVKDAASTQMRFWQLDRDFADFDGGDSDD
ncbi:hypothetical protein [Natrinema salsiterrestre]|uniref:Uncharacterized protein n=1 Tax=Natrinema salsiterrestre TaxID=2950540 RepID=A0A9Q4L950_9EURY|nr:hypothetical protein [Natrinema salsiterrestre]MDF9748310.1 hypothetical protein [Natrinema salsiterrestre]